MKIHPELGRRSKVMRQAQGGVRASLGQYRSPGDGYSSSIASRLGVKPSRKILAPTLHQDESEQGLCLLGIFFTY
jgi:hypothetical protein